MTTATKQEIVTLAPSVPAPVTPMQMIQEAAARGNMDVVAKLMDLQERWEKNQSRKAFDAAIASAKAEIPVITKNREVDFTSTKGRTNYRFEDFAGIARIVDPILSKYGLSYRYRTTSNINEPVAVTCILSHREGHSEETTLSAGRDESGNKNSIQAIGSTVTYLQRYTLKAALGLASSNDDDAQAVSAPAGTSALTDEQIETIRSLIVETASDIGRFCRYMRVERIEDIPARQFKQAVAALEAKRSKT